MKNEQKTFASSGKHPTDVPLASTGRKTSEYEGAAPSNHIP